MQYMYGKVDFNKYLYQNCHCVNAGQSKEERKCKYKLARYFGKSPSWARALRDWRLNSFAKSFGYTSWKSMIKILLDENKGGDIIRDNN